MVRDGLAAGLVVVEVDDPDEVEDPVEFDGPVKGDVGVGIGDVVVFVSVVNPPVIILPVIGIGNGLSDVDADDTTGRLSVIENVGLALPESPRTIGQRYK